jgi:gliding motility-associated-like protein
MLIAEPVSCPQNSDTIKKDLVISNSIPGINYTLVRVAKNVAYPLTARNIGNQYLWQPGEDLSDPNSRTPFVKTTSDRLYRIKITLGNGCSTTDTLLVKVYNKTEVFVPQAFTPNSNNQNDLLRPIVVNIPVINYFRVYNRWGQLIFETQRIGEGWDGIFRGERQPTETYTWTFEGRDVDGKIIRSKGQSVLIR